MENLKSRVGTQPGLSVTNEEIMAKFPDLCQVPAGQSAGPCFVGAIGTASTGRDGKQYIPVTIFQHRNDLYPNSRSEANKFFRGWDALENLVRHIENVAPEVMAQLQLKEGSLIEGAGLFVDYQVGEMFYTRGDGTPQDPVFNPTTEMYLAINDKLLYRNTRLQFDENTQHTGLELRQKATEIDEETKDAYQAKELNQVPGSVVVEL